MLGLEVKLQVERQEGSTWNWWNSTPDGLFWFSLTVNSSRKLCLGPRIHYLPKVSNTWAVWGLLIEQIFLNRVCLNEEEKYYSMAKPRQWQRLGGYSSSEALLRSWSIVLCDNRDLKILEKQNKTLKPQAYRFRCRHN